MIKELIKLANDLDESGHRKEADSLDSVINKIAEWGIGGQEQAPVVDMGEVSSEEMHQSLTSPGALASSIAQAMAENNWAESGTNTFANLSAQIAQTSLSAEEVLVDANGDVLPRAAEIITQHLSGPAE